ncbi:MAG: ATP-binding protein [Sandaracinaceae bacterium]
MSREGPPRSGSPYRGGGPSAPAAPRERDGIVDELIRQFADPLAFYRELVQNAIDAGSSQISVTLGWEPEPSSGEAGLARISVRDDGCGMGRRVLEEQLTVLFRSGKEGQSDKIGKFGVGFVSVLAIEPAQVLVRSSEGDGTEWTLVLAPDQTYDLFQAEGGAHPGTTVTLEVPCPKGNFVSLVQGSEGALVRWCRHAQIPIRFVASFGGGEALREARIDRPIGTGGLVEVRRTRGATTVAAGLAADASSYVAFFNRGLLLYETDQPLLGRAHVTVHDPSLEHTLSRDNVRRDAHFENAMRVARDAVEIDLTAAVKAALDRAIGDPSAFVPLLRAANDADLSLIWRDVTLPILEVDGARARTVHALRSGRVYAGRADDPVARAAAEARMVVLDLTGFDDPAAYLETLQAILSVTPPDVRSELSLLTPVPHEGIDHVLAEGVADALEACVRRPSRVAFARLEGALEASLSVAADPGASPEIIRTDEARADPLRRFMRPGLVLNTLHPICVAARAAAEERPELAAAILARAVLLTRGRLGPTEDERWIAFAQRSPELG